VPGPSAVLAALVVSGLPTARFCFEGFLARRGSDRRRRLGALAAEERTVVLYEAPGRLAATLVDLAAACGGDRSVAVARELTKLHEEVWRGTLAESVAAFSDREVRGEIVIVVAGAPPAAVVGDTEIADAVRRHVDGGASWRDAAGAAAAEHGTSRRDAYELAMVLRRAAEEREGGGGDTDDASPRNVGR
jgi:16S rRNA (cytidine1402-2'-O)-methyltransferase